MALEIQVVSPGNRAYSELYIIDGYDEIVLDIVSPEAAKDMAYKFMLAAYDLLGSVEEFKDVTKDIIGYE